MPFQGFYKPEGIALFRHTLTLILLGTLAGCANQNLAGYMPATPDRVEYLGVTLLPPPGNDWYVAEQRDLNEWRLVYKHTLPAGVHSDPAESGMNIMVVVDALPAEYHQQFATRGTVLDEFRKRLEAPGPDYLKTLSSKTTLITIDGNEAVCHTRTSEDLSNPAAHTLLDAEFIALPHPKDPTLGVMITITSRRFANDPPTPLAPLTDVFVQQMHFTPPVRDAIR